MLGTIIHAGAAQDAFAVLHLLYFHHAIDIQAHRAVFRAGFAIFTDGSICHQPQGGPGEAIANPAPDNHKRRHPANRMTTSAAPEEDCHADEQTNNDIVDQVGKKDGTVSGSRHRDAVLGMK